MAGQTYRMVVQYQGSAFCGWQEQVGQRSVQQSLQKALFALTREQVRVIGASRTDSGVHARMQVASFVLPTSIHLPEKAYTLGTKPYLPRELRILSCVPVAPDFHPIRQAKKKIYRYFFSRKPIPVFFSPYVLRIYDKLDLAVMQAGLCEFVGQHDFANYRGGQPSTRSSVRLIFSARWSMYKWGVQYFEFVGQGFLKYMVRNMVGAVFELGRGRASLEDVRKSLQPQNQIKRLGCRAPAHGLVLWRVRY